MRTTKRIAYFESLDYKGFEEFMKYEFDEDNRPISKEGSEEYYERFSNWEEMNWDDFMSNLKYSTSNRECVVVGSVGLWFGRREIEAKRFDDLIDAINACIGSCDYIYIYKVNGYLEISAVHHDGTNSFEIHLLNDRGICASEKANLNNKCYHKAMEKYLF